MTKVEIHVDGGAKFNDARTHRQALWRSWDGGRPELIVIGMNPSKADETDNDPTVERCQRRAYMLGYGGLRMLNILDVVETDSKKLDAMTPAQRCTTVNELELLKALSCARRGEAAILCAWGKPGHKYGRADWFLDAAARNDLELYCLGTNKDGSPVHPLYQPYEKPLIPYTSGQRTVSGVNPPKGLSS